LIVTTSQTSTSSSGVAWYVTPELALDPLRQPVAVGVVQPDLEWLEPPQHGRADAPRGDRADLHAENRRHVFAPPTRRDLLP
jgi:hypothetical protein